jgi:hypothetical protein
MLKYIVSRFEDFGTVETGPMEPEVAFMRAFDTEGDAKEFVAKQQNPGWYNVEEVTDYPEDEESPMGSAFEACCLYHETGAWQTEDCADVECLKPYVEDML